MAVYGDTSGNLGDHQHGRHQRLRLGDDGGDAFGDAEELHDASRGGHDLLVGGANAVVNNLFGDADAMLDRSRGGNDTLVGGAHASFNNLYGDAFFLAGDTLGGKDLLTGGAGAFDNTLHGDARFMLDRARGGDDLLIGGANATSNTLYGDAWNIRGAARGGNDTLIGAGGSTNYLYGDAQSLSGSAVGGNDRLVSGRGTDLMWGDAADVGPGAKTGADIFAFAPGGGDDSIFDFRHSDGDRIDVSAYGIRNLADMTITQSGGDARIDLAPVDHGGFLGLLAHVGAFGGADCVTLAGVGANTLQASDFIFAPNHAS